MFELRFLPAALKEWHALDKAVRLQFARKLEKLLAEPHVASMKLSGLPGAYWIKLRKAGYRLIYYVDRQRVVVTVLKVARRDKDESYRNLEVRLGQLGFME